MYEHSKCAKEFAANLIECSRIDIARKIVGHVERILDAELERDERESKETKISIDEDIIIPIISVSPCVCVFLPVACPSFPTPPILSSSSLGTRRVEY